MAIWPWRYPVYGHMALEVPSIRPYGHVPGYPDGHMALYPGTQMAIWPCLYPRTLAPPMCRLVPGLSRLVGGARVHVPVSRRPYGPVLPCIRPYGSIWPCITLYTAIWPYMYPFWTLFLGPVLDQFLDDDRVRDSGQMDRCIGPSGRTGSYTGPDGLYRAVHGRIQGHMALSDSRYRAIELGRAIYGPTYPTRPCTSLGTTPLHPWHLLAWYSRYSGRRCL